MRLMAFSLVAVSALALGGCELFSKSNAGPLVADVHSPIADVPVPAGFTRASNSSSKQIPGNSLRFVDHHYKGSDGMLQVVNFYKEQLPKFKWTQPEIHEMGKEVSLHSTNDRNEDCTVTVSQTWTGGSTIHVQINPAGRTGGN